MMPWLKHKKDDEPEVGIGDHDLSGVRAKITSVQLNVKLKSC